MPGSPQHPAKLVACLAIVYLVWGSSFLFSKIGVTHLPPLLFCAVRFLTAGSLLALVLGLFDNLVHTRDAWTSVVPAGLALSAITVVVMLATVWLAAPRAARQPAGRPIGIRS